MISDLIGFGLSTFLLGFVLGGMFFVSIKKDCIKAGVMEFRGRIYRIVDVTSEAKGLAVGGVDDPVK